MQDDVIITCSVTGNLTSKDKAPHLPITPQQIAESCLEAAEAGASIAHIHVRHPETGAPSMDVGLYREVIERIRAKNDAIIINLTTGPGGRYHPSEDNPAVAGPRTTLIRPERRVEHVVALKPDVCSLDLNTMMSGGEVVINTPENVRVMAEIIAETGVKPELELFDSGDIQLALDMLAKGLLKAPLMACLVTGVKYGLPATPDAMAFAARMLPRDTQWTGFGIGRMAFAMAAQSYLLGGHVRIGMEDTSYLSRGRFAVSNAELVERVRDIVEKLGGRIADPGKARQMLGLAT